MRVVFVLGVAALTLAQPLSAQEVTQGLGASLRALDKVSGETRDFELSSGEAATYGRLRIELEECRYPTEDPSSNAYALLNIAQEGKRDVEFSGWMVAGSPGLNALDDPRYDVWVLRCKTSEGVSTAN
ncbi:DUF2155 domain-containing protein [Brevirhabdus sp.]|uniref:DUF2155 domain-containing protein n=1 Tax=Brevirhabdus sp. TaxID=2004514 RepID=UPI004057F558